MSEFQAKHDRALIGWVHLNHQVNYLIPKILQKSLKIASFKSGLLTASYFLLVYNKQTTRETQNTEQKCKYKHLAIMKIIVSHNLPLS